MPHNRGMCLHLTGSRKQSLLRVAASSNKVYLPRMSPSPFANMVARQINADR